ncbi:MAG: hypothetical protein ABFS10_10825 [Bacteroidota bacterium]
MILLFRIISDEDPEFLRDLVIDSSDSFLDFHQTLQENLGYDASQLASFFITNEMWEKQQEITLIDMMEEPGVEALTMGEVTMDTYLSEINQRMIYVFDFFSERVFFMELIEKSDQTSSRKTPFIGDSRGDAPPQLALDLLTGETDPDLPEKDPLDMDLLDETDDLRIDDLDPDLLSSGNPEDLF